MSPKIYFKITLHLWNNAWLIGLISEVTEYSRQASIIITLLFLGVYLIYITIKQLCYLKSTISNSLSKFTKKKRKRWSQSKSVYLIILCFIIKRSIITGNFRLITQRDGNYYNGYKMSHMF